MLPAYLAQSGHHRVSDPPAVSGYELEFGVASDQGDFTVRSIPMLALRVREIATVAQAGTQFARNTRAAESRRQVELRGQRQSGQRSLTGLREREPGAGTGLSESVSSGAANSLFQLDGKKVITPGQTRSGPKLPTQLSLNDPIVQGHRRSAAGALGLDVYSTNPNVQALLDDLAIARASGNAQAGAISVSLPGNARARVAGGRVDTAVRGALARYPRQALFERNAAALGELGVTPGAARAFMTAVSMSPRQRTEIVEHLAFMSNVENRAEFVAGASGAVDEIDAERWAYAARALAHYHERHGPLARIVSAANVPVATTRDGAMALLLPFDVVYWDKATARVFEGAARFAGQRGIERREVILAGVLTPAARDGIQSKGFLARERYLNEDLATRPGLGPTP